MHDELISSNTRVLASGFVGTKEGAVFSFETDLDAVEA